MTEWVASIPLPHLELTANLRRFPELSAAFGPNHIWLKGPLQDQRVPDNIRFELRKIPHSKVFYLKDDSLQPENRRLLYGPAPLLEWMEIRKAFTVVLPPSVLPAENGAIKAITLKPQLVRSVAEKEPTVLVTEKSTLLSYARCCPEVRLKHLNFGLDLATDRIVVKGSPLPPLNGHLFHENENIALPCGWQWHIPMDPETTRLLVSAAPEDLVLFAIDGSYEIVPGACFVRASRSAIRLTVGEQYHV